MWGWVSDCSSKEVIGRRRIIIWDLISSQLSVCKLLGENWVMYCSLFGFSYHLYAFSKVLNWLHTSSEHMDLRPYDSTFIVPLGFYFLSLKKMILIIAGNLSEITLYCLCNGCLHDYLCFQNILLFPNLFLILNSFPHSWGCQNFYFWV